MGADKDANQYSEAEAARRYRATLASVLATPPDHKTKTGVRSERARKAA